MKSILVVQTQHDGLMQAGLTNIKALFSYIADFNPASIQTVDKDYNHKTIKYTYQNLVKTIKDSQKLRRFCVANLLDVDGNTIDISDLYIRSK